MDAFLYKSKIYQGDISRSPFLLMLLLRTFFLVDKIFHPLQKEEKTIYIYALKALSKCLLERKKSRMHMMVSNENVDGLKANTYSVCLLYSRVECSM